MKKSVVILLLSLYLLGTTQLRELLKFPVLIEHFTEHRVISPNIDFWDFLCLHYSKSSDYDKDLDRDMQLPFKTFSQNYVYDIALLSDDDSEVFLISNIIPVEKKQSLIYEGFIFTSTYLSNIWQPPKSC